MNREGGNWKAECWELKERKILKKDEESRVSKARQLVWEDKE